MSDVDSTERPQPVDYPAVEKAAQQVLLMGYRPTLEKVRSALGRGSFSTIKRHLDAWYALRAEADGLKTREAPAAPADLQQSFAELWTRACSAAAATFAAEREEAAAGVRRAEQRAEDAESSLEATRVALGHANALLADRADRIKSLEGTQERLRAAADDQRAAHEKQLAELQSQVGAEIRRRESAEAAAAELRQTLALARSDSVAKERAADAALQQQEARLEEAKREIERLNDSLAERDRELAVARGEVARQVATISLQGDMLSANAKTEALLRSSLEDSQRSAADLKSEIATARANLAHQVDTEKRLELELHAARAALQNAEKAAQARDAVLQNRIETLTQGILAAARAKSLDDSGQAL